MKRYGRLDENLQGTLQKNRVFCAVMPIHDQRISRRTETRRLFELTKLKKAPSFVIVGLFSADHYLDFSKHAPNEIVPKIRMLWNSIPSQLARENKKFIYGLVREGGRAREYETAIMWLSDCGLVHKVSRVNAAGIPLKAYEDLKAFKLFIVDVGLLGCMTGLRQRTLLDGDDLFVEFKGALTEQYVCQQLKTIEDLGVYYYTNDRGSCEIDFVVDTGEQIVPIEVKAETNLRAKSLKTYRERFEPELSVRTSMADYKKEDWLLNLPLYAIENITVES